MRRAVFVRSVAALVLLGGVTMSLAVVRAGARPETMTAAAVVAPASWPQWRRPQPRQPVDRHRAAEDSGPPAARTLAWQASGLGAGFSSVAIVGDRIFTMGDQGSDADRPGAASPRTVSSSGRPASARPGTTSTPARAARPPSTATSSTRSAPRAIWSASRPATGKERWRRSLPGDFGGQMMSGWKFSESPLVDGDRVIVTPGSRSAALVALDKRTGKEVWRSRACPSSAPRAATAPAYSSIVVSNGGGVKQYVQLLGPRPGRRARRGRPVPLGLQQGRQRRRQHRHAGRQGRLRLRLHRLSDRQRAGEARRRPGAGVVKAEEVYFLDGRTFQNHHGGFVLVGDHIYGGHGHRLGIPICVELRDRQGELGRQPPQRGLGLGGGRPLPTATCTSATRTASCCSSRPRPRATSRRAF